MRIMRKMLLTSALSVFCVGVAVAQTVGNVTVAAKTDGVKAMAVSHICGLKAKAVGCDKVLASKAVGKNMTLKVVQDGQGRIYKTMEKGDGTTRLSRPFAKPHKADATNAALFESFEGWQESYGMDWIPEGWTEKNTDANKPTAEMLAHNINNTWYCYYTGDGNWTPKTTDGEKDCFIHFTYDGSYTDDAGNTVEVKAAPQDEWLITPKLSLTAGQNLYFCAAFDFGSAYSFDWNTMAYNRGTIENNLDVRVSTDDGATWTRVWDAVEDVASKKTDDELYNLMTVLEFNTYAVDLSAYAGKDIKIAFRYTNIGTGFSGNSAVLDAVFVGAPQPEAKYDLPVGSLLAGVSETFYTTTESAILMPAYTDIQWTDASNSYTDRVKWSFGPGNMTDVIIEKDERNPLMAYPYTKEWLPMLEAYNDNGSDMFQWGETDANAPYIQYGGKITDSGFDFGVGNYDYLHNRITTQLFSEGHYCFGTGSDDDWGAKLVSVANFFEKPAAPMFVNKMYMTLGALDADNDAEFDLIVHGIDDYGYMADTIARAKGKMSDVASKGSLYNLPFKFYTIDANGQQNDTTFLFDRPILVEVSGFADNSKVRTFAAMSQSKNHDAGANYAYAAFELTDKSGNLKKYWYSASNILSDCNTSLVMSLDGVFSFVHADNAEITIPKDGGSVSEVIDSYFEAKYWTATVNGVQYSLATPLTVDWLTILPSYGMSNNEHTSFYAPATTTEREMDVTIECRGGSQTFHVKQGGSAGISATKVTAKPVVSVNGGVVTISGVASQVGSSAMLYSANGTLAAKTVVNADGTATLNANALPFGVYVIKVGKQTVKFVK